MIRRRSGTHAQCSSSSNGLGSSARFSTCKVRSSTKLSIEHFVLGPSVDGTLDFRLGFLLSLSLSPRLRVLANYFADRNEEIPYPPPRLPPPQAAPSRRFVRFRNINYAVPVKLYARVRVRRIAFRITVVLSLKMDSERYLRPCNLIKLCRREGLPSSVSVARGRAAVKNNRPLRNCEITTRVRRDVTPLSLSRARLRSLIAYGFRIFFYSPPSCPPTVRAKGREETLLTAPRHSGTSNKFPPRHFSRRGDRIAGQNFFEHFSRSLEKNERGREGRGGGECRRTRSSHTQL